MVEAGVASYRTIRHPDLSNRLIVWGVHIEAFYGDRVVISRVKRMRMIGVVFNCWRSLRRGKRAKLLKEDVRESRRETKRRLGNRRKAQKEKNAGAKGRSNGRKIYHRKAKKSEPRSKGHGKAVVSPTKAERKGKARTPSPERTEATPKQKK